jgi:hypothetical protein
LLPISIKSPYSSRFHSIAKDKDEKKHKEASTITINTIENIIHSTLEEDHQQPQNTYTTVRELLMSCKKNKRSHKKKAIITAPTKKEAEIEKKHKMKRKMCAQIGNDLNQEKTLLALTKRNFLFFESSRDSSEKVGEIILVYYLLRISPYLSVKEVSYITHPDYKYGLFATSTLQNGKINCFTNGDFDMDNSDALQLAELITLRITIDEEQQAILNKNDQAHSILHQEVKTKKRRRGGAPITRHQQQKKNTKREILVGPASLINGSCRSHANMMFAEKCDQVYVIGLKTIQVGEELVLFYSTEYCKQLECQTCKVIQEVKVSLFLFFRSFSQTHSPLHCICFSLSFRRISGSNEKCQR